MITHLYQAFLAGSLAGFGSGLLGVSSGGILVPVLAVAFGIEQHLAQMISLAAQILPTSLPGVLLYQKKGYPIAWKAVAIITSAFIFALVSPSPYLNTFICALVSPLLIPRGTHWCSSSSSSSSSDSRPSKTKRPFRPGLA